MSSAPKLVPETGSAFRRTRKAIKRLTSKIRRRISKQVDRDIPTHVTKGWVD
jgi:hypothetical protein